MRKAVIFDMDGVISDTQLFHGKIESVLLKKNGIHISPGNIAKKYAGICDEDMFRKIFKEFDINPAKGFDVVVEKWKLMNKIPLEKIKPIPFVLKFIKVLKKEGFLLAVASGSPKLFVHKVLKTLKIADKFDAIVSFEDVSNGKPAPDMFLFIAKRLRVDPHHVVVIEDGESGMIAAKSAGMKSIGLVKNIHGNYSATKLVTKLNQISLEDMYALLAN